MQDLRASREALRSWAASRSTRFALLIGGLTYLSYAAMHDAWGNPALIGVSLFFAIALPWYSRISNLVEQRANHLSALAGRPEQSLSLIGAAFVSELGSSLWAATVRQAAGS